MKDTGFKSHIQFRQGVAGMVQYRKDIRGTGCRLISSVDRIHSFMLLPSNREVRTV